MESRSFTSYSSRLEMSIPPYLAEGLEPFSFSCQVRRVGKPDMGVIRYGCQFEALPPKEQDRLAR